MASVNRRGFLKGSLAALPPAAGAAHPAAGIVDTSVYLSQWPFRRMDRDTTAELVALLRRHGVAQAWAGSFDALLHKDMSSVNARLAAECRRHGRDILVPFGTVNPVLPDWEEDLRRCHEELKMPGIRVHPNYQNYTLKDPAFERLLRAAAERGLMVQIVCWMEDERHHHPLVRIPTVDLNPLPGLLERVPRAKVAVANGFQTVSGARQTLARLGKFDRVAVDFAMMDALMELRALIETTGIESVVFGSYSPMFYFESAALKLREAALSDAETLAIHRDNARRLLGP